MNRPKLYYPNLVYGLLIIYILASYSVLAMGGDILKLTIHEDCFFEVLGAASFLLTAVFFFICFLRTRNAHQKTIVTLLNPLIYLCLSFIFFFGAGEEISWGQRIFDFQTPEGLSTINRQDELTLHNLDILDSGQFFSADRIFDIFWFTFTIILPGFYLFIPWFRGIIDSAFGQLAPLSHWSMGILFLFNYLWAKVAKIIFRSYYTYSSIPYVQAVQEIKESNYGFLFVFVALYFLRNIHQLKNRKVLR